MQNENFVNGLLEFIKKSPTPFHAVQTMVDVLENAGFQRLDETEQWSVKQQPSSGRYFVTRNDSSIIAFQINQSLL